MSSASAFDDPRQSLHAHAVEKGRQIQAQYGPRIGWNELGWILQDRKHVRYPCQIVFDADPLDPGEFAYAAPQGDRPEEGFVLYLHPLLMTRLESVPAAVLYHLVAVNYGAFASADDAEAFGAAALGLDRERYYHSLCELADEIAGRDGSAD